MFKQVDSDKLVAHPDASSRMSRVMIKKLSRCIQATGKYEAVVVRPLAGGFYQILDGHARVQSLRALEQKQIACDVWDIDDDAARLFIAACNSVRGVSVPELRMGLLFDLLERFSPAELGAMLPESETQLTSLLALNVGADECDWANSDAAVVDECLGSKSAVFPKEPEAITMTLRMTRSQYAAIKAVLDDFMQKAKIQNMGEALTQYLLSKAG